MDVSLSDISDQFVSPPDIFGPERFARCLFWPEVSHLYIMDLDVLPPIWKRTFRPRTFWAWTFHTQVVSPLDCLGLDVSVPDVSEQDILLLIIVLFYKICFSWKLCHLGEFTSLFCRRCFTIHVTLWRNVRDYATLLEVTLTSMRH